MQVHRILGCTLISVALAACSADHDGSESTIATAAESVRPAGVRSAHTATGIEVGLVPDPDPLVTGANRLTLDVAGDAVPLSVDLLSSSMPVHGVVRYAVRRESNGFSATIEFPMEGEWSIYVNFDPEGLDSAEIPLVVAAAPGDPSIDALPHAHHGSANAPDSGSHHHEDPGAITHP